ncbi:hypothetical protein ACIP8Z_33905 [Streptomyces sp. NPDC088553]|uniref:hypothetical protein n=1 Tax=Streptomyces sp. NPDC088553 TaxID=3365864 RepID=UPI003804151C
MRLFLLILTVAFLVGGLVLLAFASTTAAVVCAVYLVVVIPLAVLVGRAVKRSGPPSSD